MDFVLVWDSKSEYATTRSSQLKRETFERNLELEGLVLSKDENCETGLNFVKLFVPREVLKRYAEILKLRLPMKKFDHIQEVHQLQIDSIPIIGDVVKGVRSGLSRFTEPFMYNQRKFPSKHQDLTAVFSRDKEYL